VICRKSRKFCRTEPKAAFLPSDFYRQIHENRKKADFFIFFLENHLLFQNIEVYLIL